ncbi:aconitase [Acetomicrobium flavidum]|uniref:Aconitase n=1 Tax=Acetomicrobium flavidum TaxID=49896 RepID=A0ABY1JEX2_9BACT|nr:aconitase [Acetomicrobium flavidum]
MALTITEKIIKHHLINGTLDRGRPITIKIDQTLVHDATGTMAMLELEATGIKRVKTDLSVAYIDHNMIQEDFKNPDDHRFLQDMAAKYGVMFSRPGNGICHHVHLERFAVPGKTLLGSDSHTPTAGGIGMLAIGAGGLDVALAMAGEPFTLIMPKIVKVNLIGKLPSFVSAKDVILEVLRRVSVKGGVGKVFEYCGPGVKSLSVSERATITNMGAETGATTSIFESDEVTRQWLRAQGREREWVSLHPDIDAVYDEEINIDLSLLEPLVARPFLPDNVVPVKEVTGIRVDQVMFGSCTNSSLRDILTIAHMLKGKRIHPNVDAGLSPGSRQILLQAGAEGALEDLITAGVRILEASCGACVGMGFAPPSEGVSVRTINRNFYGRCGHTSGKVYLASPEVAAAACITGEIADPRDVFVEPFYFEMPSGLIVDEGMFIAPSPEPEKIVVRRGPNIKPLPEMGPLPDKLEGKALIKVGDDITTDHIMPAGAKFLPLRSNIPAISDHVFEVLDPTFAKRAKELNGGFIVAGANYGQGSSREHAALAPKYLGIKAVVAKSFARIHLANLVNFGILPLIFADVKDYEKIDQGDDFFFDVTQLDAEFRGTLHDLTKNIEIEVVCPLSADDLKVVKAGGRLNWIKLNASNDRR